MNNTRQRSLFEPCFTYDSTGQRIRKQIKFLERSISIDKKLKYQ